MFSNRSTKPPFPVTLIAQVLTNESGIPSALGRFFPVTPKEVPEQAPYNRSDTQTLTKSDRHVNLKYRNLTKNILLLIERAAAGTCVSRKAAFSCSSIVAAANI